ncbi:cardiolipin synthase [Acrasis kona]|uniref:Cardiolipin synthase n=1 Tax=Acrasis kona TaxID=1008807 RepID=A0AAW2YVZ8_9EUKA
MAGFTQISLLVAVVLLSCVQLSYCYDVAILGGSIGGGVGGLILLILDIIAIFEILNSGMPILNKLLWILLVLFFPLLGFILYCLCGRSRKDYHAV